MSDIQFEEEQQFRQFQQPAENKPFFVRLVLSTGLVTTDRQAEYVLLGFAALMIILAFLIPTFFGGSHVTVPKSVIDAAIRTPNI